MSGEEKKLQDLKDLITTLQDLKEYGGDRIDDYIEAVSWAISKLKSE